MLPTKHSSFSQESDFDPGETSLGEERLRNSALGFQRYFDTAEVARWWRGAISSYMRLVFAAFGVAVALATVTGCSSQQKAAQSSDDVVRSMRAELSKTVDSDAVGTTSLTNADLIASNTPALPPMMLPESRMSLAITEQAESEPTPVATAEDGSPMFMVDDEPAMPTQTWGMAVQLDLTEIPDTRE
jgi:hypothetical protein